MKTFLLAMVAATTVLAAETENFHALLDREWNYNMQEWPTAASSLGDRRWNDKWPDITEPAMARRVDHSRQVLADRARRPVGQRAQQRLKGRLHAVPRTADAAHGSTTPPGAAPRPPNSAVRY